MKLAPEPKRSSLYALYAWMRQADDLIDNAAAGDLSCRSVIDEFRAQTLATFNGSAPNRHPFWLALFDTAQRFKLDPVHFEQMLDGQLSDIVPRPYETFDDLKTYCHHVASTVGLLCIEIWGYADPSARQRAIERGIAFQLTNILRDVREDFDAGRIYLPREDFSRFDLTPQQLRSWSKPDACRAMVLQQVDRAASFYESSAPLDEMISPDCRPTLWAMTRIYHQLLERIRERPELIVRERRMRISSWQKGAIALQARWGIGASRAATV